MPARVARAVEPVTRAEVQCALPDMAMHLREAALAGVLVGAGWHPEAALAVARQSVMTGMVPPQLARMVEPLTRAEARHALADLALHIQHAAMAGALVAAGQSPRTALALAWQTMGAMVPAARAGLAAFDP